jgi:hypothetical protein
MRTSPSAEVVGSSANSQALCATPLSAHIGRLENGRAAEHWSEQGMFPMLVQLGVLPAPPTP